MLKDLLHYELLPVQKKTPLISRNIIPVMDSDIFPIFLTSRFDGTFLPVPNKGQSELGSAYFHQKSEKDSFEKLLQALLMVSLKYGFGNIISRDNFSSDTFLDFQSFFKTLDMPLKSIHVDSIWAQRLMNLGKIQYRRIVQEPEEPEPWQPLTTEPSLKSNIEYQIYNTPLFISWDLKTDILSCWSDPELVGSYFKCGDHASILLHNLPRGLALLKYQKT